MSSSCPSKVSPAVSWAVPSPADKPPSPTDLCAAGGGGKFAVSRVSPFMACAVPGSGGDSVVPGLTMTWSFLPRVLPLLGIAEETCWSMTKLVSSYSLRWLLHEYSFSGTIASTRIRICSCRTKVCRRLSLSPTLALVMAKRGSLSEQPSQLTTPFQVVTIRS